MKNFFFHFVNKFFFSVLILLDQGVRDIKLLGWTFTYKHLLL